MTTILDPITSSYLVASALLSILILYAARAITESRFDSLAIVVNIFCLLQGFSLLGSKLASRSGVTSADPRVLQLALPLLLAVLIFLALVFVQFLLVQGRKSRTNDYVKNLLETTVMEPNDRRVASFIAMSKEMIDEDFFPGSFPENVLNAKARRRQIFYDCLPDELFDKKNKLTSSMDFCLPPKMRKGVESHQCR